MRSFKVVDFDKTSEQTMLPMRSFKVSDFNKTSEQTYAQDASYLRFPARTPVDGFLIEGLGKFTLAFFKEVSREPSIFVYVYRNAKGDVVEVFND